MSAGVDGLLRDRTRPARIPPLPKAVVEAVVTRTLDEAPPDGTTHWTAPAMAAATGVSVSSVLKWTPIRGPGAWLGRATFRRDRRSGR